MSSNSDGTGLRPSFKTTALAASTVVHLHRDQDQRRAKIKKRISRNSSLEEFNKLNDAPPQKLAAQGDLDGLKACIESFGLTLKETDKNGCTLLHHATYHDQLVVMEYLIESGANLDAVETDGNTALHIAVQREFIDAVNLLLKSGASDTILNKQLDAPLHIIVRMTVTNKELLAAFLQHQSIELMIAGYHQRTPTHIIAEHDKFEIWDKFGAAIAVRLRENKEGVKERLCATDADGLTAIHLAARKGSHRVLKFMMESSKELSVPTDVVLGYLDEENSTPLHAAVDGGHLQVVKVFLEYGASPLVSRGDLIPALHLACSQGKIDMVKAMVEAHGCEILSELDQYQRSPLHYSALSINGAGIISYIMEQVAHPELDAEDQQGRTPLHSAVTSGNVASAKELLAKGGNPLAQCKSGDNALHLAVIHNRKPIVSVLLDHQCASDMVLACNEKGDSPIHLALKLKLAHVVSDMVAVIRFQLQNIKDAQGNNYLHLAAKSGDWKALEILFNIPTCQKLLNETNEYGATPLHMAAKQGHQCCSAALLGQGAMVHRCHEGKTPFMDACRNGHAACARVLYTAHPFQVDWTDHAGNTALHYAAKSGDPNTVKEALDMGCQITHNNDLESFLDVIISSSSKDCAMAVVNHSRWQECLDFQSPLSLHPMIRLIVNMPDVAKSVLDRCHKKSKLHETDHDFCEAFDFKYVRLEIPHCLTSLLNSQSVMPNTTDELHPGSIRYKGSKTAHKPPQKLTQENLKKEDGIPPSMVALQTMLQYKRANLLIHPVVSTYLKQKWNKYGRALYLSLYLTELLMVILLTAFIAVVPNPTIQSTNTSQASNFSGDYSLNGSTSNDGLSSSAQALRVLVLILNSVLTLIIAVLLTRYGQHSLRIVTSSPFLVHILTFALVYIFLLAPNPLTLWPVGALACFSSWFDLFLGLEFFGTFGVYVKMFLQIVRTVFKVLVICSLLIFAFAVVFYMLAGSITQFSMISYSLFLMFGYMMGEIQYDLFIVEDSLGRLRYGYFVFIVVIILTIVMSIVMANLLIGLAVGDIERIKHNALLETRSVEIRFFSLVDFVMPNKLQDYWKTFHLKLYPNSPVSRLHKVWRTVSKTFKTSLFNDLDTDSPTNALNSTITEELIAVKKQLAQMTEFMALIHQQNSRNQRKRQESVDNSSTSSDSSS